MSPPNYMYLSSSIVREIASYGGPFKQFTRKPVFHAPLREVLARRGHSSSKPADNAC